jgi:hypothetical protein
MMLCLTKHRDKLSLCELKSKDTKENQDNAEMDTDLFRLGKGLTGLTLNGLVKNVPRKYSWT